MQNIEFEIKIAATAERVWFALWDEQQYRNWTSVFHEGSYAVSDWNEGSKIHFLTPGGNGMHSVIEQNKPMEKMVFRHMGEIKNFEEQPLNDETREWNGATESYTLTEYDGITSLIAGFTSIESHMNFFNEFIPKALEKIKQAAENLEIYIEARIDAKLERVWKKWINPADVLHWNAASEDWHTTRAENDLRPGGTFIYRMEAKQGNIGFDFSGKYSEVIEKEQINYKLDDGRHVKVLFSEENGITTVAEFFEAEKINTAELQKNGWQAILNHFKKYVESGT